VRSFKFHFGVTESVAAMELRIASRIEGQVPAGQENHLIERSCPRDADTRSPRRPLPGRLGFQCNNEIGVERFISERTVRSGAKSIFAKLNIIQSQPKQ
jgi:hypothetical protein